MTDQPPSRWAYPGIAQALLLLPVLVVVMMVVALPIFSFFSARGIDVSGSPVVLAVINLIAFSSVLWWGYRQTGKPFARVFPLTPFRARLLLPLVLALLGAIILLSEVDNLMRLILPMPASVAKLFESLAGAGTSIPGAAFALILVAPFTEEFLFRGLILSGFLVRYSPLKAVLAQAILFGVFHLNPWQLVTAVALGVLFGWLRVRTGSLWPGLIGHAVNNSLPVIYLAGGMVKIPGFASAMTGHVVFQPFWFDCLGVAFAAGGIFLLRRMLREPRAHAERELDPRMDADERG